MNSVDDHIKWMTEGEVVTKAPSDGSAMVGEDMSIRVERALVFLDTWKVVESDGSISTKVFRKDTHTDQYLSISAVATCWNTREIS